MKKIPLINSKEFVLVSDEDFDFLIRLGPYYLNNDGYAITNKEPHVLLHNLLLPVSHLEVDHKDRVKLNCTRENLRRATTSQNRANRDKQKNNTSGYKGAYLERRTGKYFAKIQVNGQVICLGTFLTVQEAAYRYDQVAIKHFGEFARLNFPLIARELAEARLQNELHISLPTESVQVPYQSTLNHTLLDNL